MRKKIAILFTLAALALTLLLTGCGQSKPTLNIYNWGEYISDGSEGSLDTVAAFEEWYEAEYGVDITVNYSTFPSNEDMYNKLAQGAVSYDVIIPSDYMIERMIEEDLLLPLNYDNIPNARYIEDSFKGLYYDPQDTYSIPYTYGVVGIMYDANVVDSADAGGWDLMWNEKYANSILQYNNSRDAFGTAMYKLGLDVNSTDPAVWQQAADELIRQRPLVYSLVMDEIFNILPGGEASVGSYYAGDYFLMRENQRDGVDLRFYYPEPTNFFVDAMCIPSCAQNKELAEIFINYMLGAEAGIANAEYINYASPNRLVYEDPGYIADMGEEAMAILYPDLGDFSEQYNKHAYRNLDRKTLDMINTLWEDVKMG